MQKRKIRNFTGFQKKAVVIVPSEEELKERLQKQRYKADFKEVSDLEYLEMKGN